MMYLLDTNICSYAIRGDGSVRGRIRALDRSKVGVSVITVAELRYGIARNPKTRHREAIELLIKELPALDFTAEHARIYGDVRAALVAKGTPIGPLDTLLAAQALATSSTLVTNNIREYERVSGLRLENWIE